MRANSTGSATVLMLLALGVMAVVGLFGVPQFSPVVASSGDEGDVDLGGFGTIRDAGAGQSAVQGVEDLFARVDAGPDSRPPAENNAFPPLDLDRLEEEVARNSQVVDLLDAQAEGASESFDEGKRQPRPQPGDAAEAATRSSVPAASAFDSRFGRRESTQAMPASFGEGIARSADAPTARDSSAAAASEDRRPVRQAAADDDSADDSAGEEMPEPLTWRAAVGRLNALGIREYRLSPGTRANEFHFSCFFTPGDNPRLTHRFEAEANEPLEAVEKVLGQIQEWQNDRPQNPK